MSGEKVKSLLGLLCLFVCLFLFVLSEQTKINMSIIAPRTIVTEIGRGGAGGWGRGRLVLTVL